MTMTVRRCVRCDKTDARRVWRSMDEAADDHALHDWVCPTCAWTEGELIEVDTAETGASGEPFAPVGPDDARHAVAGSRQGV